MWVMSLGFPCPGVSEGESFLELWEPPSLIRACLPSDRPGHFLSQQTSGFWVGFFLPPPFSPACLLFRKLIQP